MDAIIMLEALRWLFIIIILIFISVYAVFLIPIKRKSMSIIPSFLLGRKREIYYLAERIKTGQSSIIIGLFSSEKTQLLGYLRNEVIEQQKMLYGNDVNDFIFSYVDIVTLPNKCTSAQLWEMVLQPLQQKSNLLQTYQECQKNQFSRSSLENLIKLLSQSNLRLVLLLDSFQEILKWLDLSQQDEFFVSLRILAASRTPSPLVVIAASNQPLKQFYEATKDLNPLGSPYLNFMEGGITILGSLPEKEVDELLGKISSSSISTAMSQRIKQLVGGHPYLLQVAATIFFGQEEQMSVEVFEKIFFDRIKNGLERMLQGWHPDYCQALLAIIKNQELDINKLKEALKELEKQGIIIKVNNQWQLRAGIFRKLITTNPQQVWCKQERED